MKRYAFSAALLSSVAGPAIAQASQANEPDSPDTIIVTADRLIIEALRGIAPEREYTETDVSDRGLSTVGEFIDEVRAENGDDEAIFLINGEPVTDIDDVADFPAEAVQRLEVLPRGSGQRIGRQSDRRIYNVVLKDQLRSATLTAARKIATEGAWGESAGEAILSHIAGRQRVNLTLRARGSDPLLEADRDIIQPAPGTTGRTADYYEPVDGGRFRTLRGESRSYEASLIGGTPIAKGVTSSFSFIGRIGRDDTLSGLPFVLFQLPGSSPFSKTGSDSTLLLAGDDPLDNRSSRRSLNGNATINATRGSWTAGLTGQFSLSHRTFRNERLDSAIYPSPVPVPGGRNPFTEPLTEYFPLAQSLSVSDSRTAMLRLNVGGPVFRLPAGQLRVRGAAQRDTDHSRTSTSGFAASSPETFSRSATRFDAGLDIPIASRRENFLGALGELSLSLDRGYDLVDRFRNLDRKGATLLWQPDQRLSITGSVTEGEELAPLDLLTDPTIIYDNVRTYDFLRGETVDLSVITGGNPALLPLRKTSRRLSMSGAAWQRYNLQLNLDYEETILRDFVAAIPAASASVLTAFPDRFQRDAAGRLVLVDSRPTNFDREDRQELRYGFSFLLPVGGSKRPVEPDSNAAVASFRTAAANSRARLQVTGSHSIALKDMIIIREGLPAIDLLDGGAIGVGGGRARHLINGSAALSGKGYGVRVAGLYRSASSTFSALPGAQGKLRYEPILTTSLKLFGELEELAPGSPWLKSTRLSLTVENFANRRQRVTDATGATPLRFQSAYRDSIGRTVELELRKTF